MLGTIYLFLCWLLLTGMLTIMLPASERSLGKVATIELVLVLLWLIEVATFM